MVEVVSQQFPGFVQSINYGVSVKEDQFCGAAELGVRVYQISSERIHDILAVFDWVNYRLIGLQLDRIMANQKVSALFCQRKLPEIKRVLVRIDFFRQSDAIIDLRL